MKPASADAACRRLVLNPKLPIKIRVAALSEMSRPSIALLSRLMRDKNTPARLVKIAIERFRVETMIRENT